MLTNVYSISPDPELILLPVDAFRWALSSPKKSFLFICIIIPKKPSEFYNMQASPPCLCVISYPRNHPLASRCTQMSPFIPQKIIPIHLHIHPKKAYKHFFLSRPSLSRCQLVISRPRTYLLVRRFIQSGSFIPKEIIPFTPAIAMLVL